MGQPQLQEMPVVVFERSLKLMRESAYIARPFRPNNYFPMNFPPLFKATMVGAFLCFATAAEATNGLNLTGFGAESSAMGGADAPLSRDTFAANLNPAGLATIQGQAFDGYLTTFATYDNTHTDALNYRKPIDHSVYYNAFGGLGYARQIPETDLTVGTALVVQGGLGSSYKHLETIFGTSDEITGLFGVSKLATSIGWKVNHRLRLGAGIGISYATASQSVFPDTSVGSFHGFRLKDLNGFGANGRVGFQYQLSDEVLLGTYYGTKTRLDIKGGNMRINYSSLPGVGGVVRYDDAKMQGVALPEELAIGLAIRPTPQLLVVVQDKWYNWSDAVQSIEIVARSPRNAAAPATVTLRSAVNMRDQHVFSAGIAYEYDDRFTLRGGLNYAKRPVPDENLSPIFSPISSHHFSLGFDRKIDDIWRFAGTLELQTRQSITYTNPNGPFGPNAVEQMGGPILHLMLSRRW